jgi:hypothetical protein
MSGTTTTGSQTDMLARLKAVLPLRWFPDARPVLDGLLNGIAASAASLYAMLAYVRQQTRLASVSDTLLDLAVTDFCGTRTRRRPGETDAVLRVRLHREVLRSRATRPAMISVLSDLTGRVPTIVEPGEPGASGGYGIASGYGVSGGYGSAAMPFQCLVTAYRPLAPGAVWSGGGGAPVPGAAAYVAGSVADVEIYAAIAETMPVAFIAWTAIAD